MASKSVTRERYPYEPDYAVPPGVTLRETLDALGMTQADLARRTGLSTKHVNQIIQGVASITPESALLLEKATGVGARFWNRLETNYQEALLRVEERSRLTSSVEWLNKVPVRELCKRGLIRRFDNELQQLEEVYRFFGVANTAAWERVWLDPQAAFRKSPAFSAEPEALASWLRIGELVASRRETDPFDPRSLRSQLDAFRRLTVLSPQGFEPQLKELCARCGVVLVLVAEVKGSRVSGATRWLTPNKAMIQLSLRYRWEDHFWFSFFHEMAHLLLHGKRLAFVDDNSGTDSTEAEQEANQFAQTTLIPPEYEIVLDSVSTESEAIKLAHKLGIAPGIVVGRLQREERIPYNWWNHLRRRFYLQDDDAADIAVG